MARVAALSRTEDDHYYDHLLGNYSTVRRFLPTLYKTIEFSGAKAGQGVLQAMQFLKEIEGQAKPAMETAPQEVLNRAWRKLVIRADGKIDRRFYTFCVLEQLQQGLDRREIFVTMGRMDRNSVINRSLNSSNGLPDMSSNAVKSARPGRSHSAMWRPSWNDAN